MIMPGLLQLLEFYQRLTKESYNKYFSKIKMDRKNVPVSLTKLSEIIGT